MEAVRFRTLADTKNDSDAGGQVKVTGLIKTKGTKEDRQAQSKKQAVVRQSTYRGTEG